MLPEHLVPPRFHLSASGQTEETVENNDNFTQGKTTLSDYEADILISTTATGQSKNILLEERDRHFKERLERTLLKALLKSKLTALSIQGQPRFLKAQRFFI